MYKIGIPKKSQRSSIQCIGIKIGIDLEIFEAGLGLLLLFLLLLVFALPVEGGAFGTLAATIVRSLLLTLKNKKMKRQKDRAT